MVEMILFLRCRYILPIHPGCLIIGSPQSHRVGSVMGVSRSDHDLGVWMFLMHTFNDIINIGSEESDQIQRHQHQCGASILNG